LITPVTATETTTSTATVGRRTLEETAREKLCELGRRRARGDVTERVFRRRLVELSVDLARSEANGVMEGDEQIVAEHHVVHSHFKMTESLLQEPEQATVSFFATDRRLVRVRGTLPQGRADLDEDATRTMLDAIPYCQVSKAERKLAWRWGEVGTGSAIVLAALLFRTTLAVTGPVLVLLGTAGVLHGLLLPTRWIEITAHQASEEPPFAIHGVWRRSARRVLAAVRRGSRKQEGGG
jgi:hypothetical protein